MKETDGRELREDDIVRNRAIIGCKQVEMSAGLGMSSAT